MHLLSYMSVAIAEVRANLCGLLHTVNPLIASSAINQPIAACQSLQDEHVEIAIDSSTIEHVLLQRAVSALNDMCIDWSCNRAVLQHNAAAVYRRASPRRRSEHSALLWFTSAHCALSVDTSISTLTYSVKSCDDKTCTTATALYVNVSHICDAEPCSHYTCYAVAPIIPHYQGPCGLPTFETADPSILAPLGATIADPSILDPLAWHNSGQGVYTNTHLTLLLY
jgi:hypothetical protein